jgi:hypothetical protein
MILDEQEVKDRFESPMNLLHRLRSTTRQKTVDSNGNPVNIIPSLPPTSEQVIEDLEEKLAYGSIKSKAAGIMIKAMDELNARLPEIQRPEKLAAIAADMSKVVNAANEDNNKNKNGGNQFIIYSPQFIEEKSLEVIYARE